MPPHPFSLRAFQGPFNPAIRAIRRLNFAGKFLLLGLVVVLGLGIITAMMVMTLEQDLRFTRKERLGVRALSTLAPVLGAVLDHQAASAGGGAPLPGPVDAAIDRMDHLERPPAPGSPAAQSWQAFKAAWAMAKAAGPGAAEAERDLHRQVLALTAQLGDDSCLVLDSQLDSYYLMDCLVAELPAQAEALNRIRLLTLREGPLTPPERTQLAVCLGTLTSLQDWVRDDLRTDKGFRNPLIRERLAAAAREDLDAVGEVDRMLPDHFLDPAPDADHGARIRRLAGEALAAQARCNEAGWPILDDLLRRRMEVKGRQVALALGVALGALAACIYLIIAIHFAFKESLARVVTALDENDPSAAQLLQPQDEFRAIAEAARAALTRLNAATLEAQAANRAKSAFLANMSHEIRTPMNAILGMLQLASRTELTEQQQDYLAKSQSAAQALMGIINDILDFSKIEAGRMVLETEAFGVHAVLEAVAALVGPRARDKHLDFRVETAPDVPSRVVGDPMRLRQILVNLCDNAVKFTPSGQVVVTTALERLGEDGSAALRFTVRDTGIGLSQAQVKDLFRPFVQADPSTTRRYGGTGLGLAIARQLAGLMGGELTVASAPGEGSAFSFAATFQPGVPAKAEPARSPQVPAGSRDMDVLLVEDNLFNQQVAKELLEETPGLRVTVAAHGLEAVQLLRARRFDAVLMDIQMPVMDGLEATRAIRSEHPGLGLPIIAMTAHALPRDRELCLEAGMDEVVTKPFVVDELLEVLARRIPGWAAPPAREDPGRAISRQAGLRHFGGKEQLYEKALALFGKLSPDAGREIRKALAEGEVQAAARTAHSLKSSSRTIGAGLLGDAAEALEAALTQGRGDVEACLSAFERHLEAVCRGLRDGTGSS